MDADITNKPKMSLTQLRKMTVPELRNELRALGLDTEGLKSVLQDRLRSALYPVLFYVYTACIT